MEEPLPSLDALLKHVLDTMAIALAEVLAHPENTDKERKGGYVYLYDIKDNVSLMHLSVGDLANRPKEKVTKYIEFSQEKAMRLLSWLPQGNVSSWQSRNEPIEKYGGAIRARRYILSFSGLSEHQDEAVCALTALRLGWINLDEVHRIAVISGNPYLRGIAA